MSPRSTTSPRCGASGHLVADVAAHGPRSAPLQSVAVKLFIFWSFDPTSRMSSLTVRITGRQLPDKSDAWSHMGLGFELFNGDLEYYECLFHDGFCGPKPISKLIAFCDAGGCVSLQPVDSIKSPEAQQIRENCRAWVGTRGYYHWQLISMWAFERFGRFLGTHVPHSPDRLVCSEAVARLVWPWMDLRDSVRDFDEVNPNSAYRKWLKIKGSNS